MYEPWQAVTVILVVVVLPLSIWSWRTFVTDQEDLSPTPAPAVPTATGGGLLLPGVLFVIWLAVVAVVGLTAIRLAWKVFRFAWS